MAIFAPTEVISPASAKVISDTLRPAARTTIVYRVPSVARATSTPLAAAVVGSFSEVEAVAKTLYVSGQASVGPDGAPLFEGEKLAKPAFVTVIHNGVLVHHHKEIIGRMAHRIVGTYAPHDPEQPLGLQDHDTSVRYRNIWVRRLAGYDRK